MGISQLLPFLEKSTRKCHLSEFRGRTVAVDTYCWLHKACRGCALKLAMNQKTDAYIEYCLKNVKLLLNYGIKPIMVFDGRPLPAKSKTESKRHEAKKVARKQGMECLKLGQSSEAYKYFAQCIDVTPEMALALIKRLRQMKIDCIVAPYEADAQLGFFSQKNIVDLVISEDSDLLLFGCKQVLYKMDQFGHGQLVDSDRLFASMKRNPTNYSFDKFRHMCILSGCDYLDSLPGIGLKKALKFLNMTEEREPSIFLNRLPRYLHMSHLKVTLEYVKNFMIADATFLHQIVFDPTTKALIPLSPPTRYAEYCFNAGDLFNNNDAFQIALGNLNPTSMERLDDWIPNENNTPVRSIWRPESLTLNLPYRNPPSLITTARLALVNPSKSIVDSRIEKAQADKDERTEKELNYYKLPVLVDGTVVESNSPSPTLKSSETSPILNNPFLKKKLFRIPPTKHVRDLKVCSRFFSNVVDVYREVDSSSSSSSVPQSDGTDADWSELYGQGLFDFDETVSAGEMNASMNTEPGDFDLDVMNHCEAILEDEGFEDKELRASTSEMSWTSGRASTSMMSITSSMLSPSGMSRTSEMASTSAMSTTSETAIVETAIFTTSEMALSSVENLPTKNRKRKAASEPEPQKKKKKQMTIEDAIRLMGTQ